MIPDRHLKTVQSMAAEEEEFIPVKVKGRKGRGRGKLCKGKDDLSQKSDGSSDLSFDSVESKSVSSLCGLKSSSSLESSSDGKDGDMEKGHGLGTQRLRSLGRGRRSSTLYSDSLTSSDFSTDSSLHEVCRLSLYDELLPPQSRVQGNFPGSSGKICRVESNHFKVNLNLLKGVIHMYDVVIEPPWRRPFRKSDKQLYHDVILAWKKQCQVIKQEEQVCWVFDGFKQLYSTRNHGAHEFKSEAVRVWSSREECWFDFTVKDVMKVADIQIQDIVDWASCGRSGSIPQDAIQAMDVVLKQSSSIDPSWQSVGRCLFPSKGHTLDLGFGKEAWCGLFSSVRPVGWKDHGVLLTLNIDTSHVAATKNMPLIGENGYIGEVLKDGKRAATCWQDGLTELQKKVLGKDLEGLKVKYELMCKNGPRKRQYRILELRKKAAKDEMINVDGEILSVVKYFEKQYGVVVKHPNLPCLWVGARDRSIYIPMEFCSMVSQVLPRRKKLPDEAVANMIKQTAVKPLERQKKIIEGLDRNNAHFKNDPFANEFGISISGSMSKLSGRILDPPSIEYKKLDGGKLSNVVTINKANPGKWFQDRNMYLDGKNVEKWAILDLAQLSDAQFKEVVDGFVKVGKENGIRFGRDVHRSFKSMKDLDDVMNTIEEFLVKIVNKNVDLIVIIFGFKAGILYDKIKQLGDMKFNISTQCCLRNNLFKGGSGLNKQVVANICMKINSKMGGINHSLSKECRPKLLRRPVMIMGADVSHPAPESRGVKPSIAAVVGSVEPKAAVYEVQVRIQDMGLVSNEEVIEDMKNVTKILLRRFYDRNGGRKPEKIVMFRDGCSEGQFLTVLSKELVAIRKACEELEEGYNPPITFLVVQKRHHTRFFPADGNQYRNGNALAGTVIDQGINHPTEGDFYLVSHEGIQGTSRPCHYHVLWDDSNFSADDLEVLAYYLCHLYSRCARSVSYPTPTYYAHLVADRARKHHNELAQADGGSSSGHSAGSIKLTESEKKRIKEVVEKGVDKPMYFV